MTTNDINTFLILADRARLSGLIQFNEMPAVLQAIEAAKKAIEAAAQAQPVMTAETTPEKAKK